MNKTLDLNKTIYQLATTEPEFLDVMETLGFGHMRECVATKDHPKVITLREVAQRHDADLNVILDAFEKAGFEIVNR